MAKKNLYINNTNLGTYGVYISSDTVLNAPSFDYVEHQVPGRDGTMLQYNNRLNNVVRKFTCYVPESGNVSTAIANVKKLIYTNPGYVKLSSDYESGTYQYGYLAQGFNVEPFKNYSSVTFDLYFSCQPYLYTNSVYETISFANGYSGVMRLYPRNSWLVQEIFNDLPAEVIPDADYFMLFSANGTTGTMDITSITDNGQFMAAITLDEDKLSSPWAISDGDYKELAGYDTNGSLDISSFTTSYYLYFITPITNTIITTDVNNSTRVTYFADYFVSKQEAGALNCNLQKLEISYKLNYNTAGNYENSSLLVYGSDNGKKTWEATIELDIESFTNDLLTDIINNYAINDGTMISVFNLVIETDTMKCYLQKGTKTMPIDAYVTIDGNFSGIGDMITTCAYTSANHGNISKVVIYPACRKIK